MLDRRASSEHEITRIPPSPSDSAVLPRRQFLAASLSAVLGVSAQRASAQESPEPAIEPQAALDGLEKLAAGSPLQNAEQGRQAVRLMRPYAASLRSGRVATPQEIGRAADLVVGKLYYPTNNAAQAFRENGGELPIAALDLEAALIAFLRNHSAGERGSTSLETRLKDDLFWYNNYEGAPFVWEHAASRFCAVYLPAEGSVDMPRFVDLLKAMPAQNAVASRVVRQSYRRLRLDPDRELAAPSGCAREKFLEQWRASIALFRDHVLMEAGNPRSLSEKDAEEFRRWHQEHLVAPFLPAIRQLLLTELSVPEHRSIGHALADGVEAEGDFDGILSVVRQWGIDPPGASAISAVAIPKRKDGKSLGRTSQLFLETYRSGMGAECWLSASLAERTQMSGPVAQRRLQKNSGAVLLSALRRLSKRENQWDAPNEELEENVGMLMLLIESGMREELERSEELPDLAHWGERVALFLSVPGGRNPALTPEEWNTNRVRSLKALLVDGTRLRSASGEVQSVPGVFARYDARLPDALIREYGITDPRRQENLRRSPLLAERKERDRQDFLEAFRAAAPDLPHADVILKEWGFTPEEIARVPGKKTADNPCEEFERNP